MEREASFRIAFPLGRKRQFHCIALLDVSSSELRQVLFQSLSVVLAKSSCKPGSFSRKRLRLLVPVLEDVFPLSMDLGAWHLTGSASLLCSNGLRDSDRFLGIMMSE